MNYILIGLLLSKQNILVAMFFMRALESIMYFKHILLKKNVEGKYFEKEKTLFVG